MTPRWSFRDVFELRRYHLPYQRDPVTSRRSMVSPFALTVVHEDVRKLDHILHYRHSFLGSRRHRIIHG